jgi:hypothetical protein
VTPDAPNGRLPGSEAAAARTAAADAKPAATRAASEPATVASTISNALERSPDALKTLAETPMFKELLARAESGLFATAFDGANELMAKQAARTADVFGGALGNLTQAAGKLSSAVANGVGNAGMRGAVAAIEAAEPIIAAGGCLVRFGVTTTCL